MFNLNQIVGRFKSDAEKRSRTIKNPTHRVYAKFEERFQAAPEEYSYDAVLTQDEVIKLKQSGYEVIDVDGCLVGREASIQQGIDDVANGDVHDLGSFAQYADIETDD